MHISIVAHPLRQRHMDPVGAGRWNEWGVCGLTNEGSVLAAIYWCSIADTTCNFTHLSDVGSALSRFETDRDVAEFVARRTTARPENSDIEKLDDVYRRLIQPILAGLESSFVPLRNSLFAGFCARFAIEYGRQRAQIGGLLNSFAWEEARLKNILREGFALSERRPLCLTHHYVFQNYTGMGRKDFGLNVAVAWRLGAQTAAQRARVGGKRIPEIKAHVPYEELGGSAARADHTIARLTQ